MFNVMNMSSMNGGSGMIIITTTITTAPAASRSVCFMMRCIEAAISRPTSNSEWQGPAASQAGRRPLRDAPVRDAVDEREQLRHRGVQLLGHLLPDLDGGVQRTRERRVG